MNTFITLLPWLTLIMSLVQMMLNLPSAITDALGLLDTVQKQKERKGIQRNTSRCVKHISTQNADALSSNIASPEEK